MWTVGNLVNLLSIVIAWCVFGVLWLGFKQPKRRRVRGAICQCPRRINIGGARTRPGPFIIPKKKYWMKFRVVKLGVQRISSQ